MTAYIVYMLLARWNPGAHPYYFPNPPADCRNPACSRPAGAPGTHGPKVAPPRGSVYK